MPDLTLRERMARAIAPKVQGCAASGYAGPEIIAMIADAALSCLAAPTDAEVERACIVHEGEWRWQNWTDHTKKHRLDAMRAAIAALGEKG